jgi:glycerophosphoryl diester phosphodiesterase
VSRRLIAAGLTLAVLPLICPASAASAAATACPVVIAHRTAAAAAPENTLPGITAAASSGAASVEMDVRWSSSSFPVLMHDSSVDRTTDGTGAVSALGLGDLRALWAADYSPWRTDPRFADVPVPYGWEFMHAASVSGLDVLLDVMIMPSELAAEKLLYYVDLFGWRSRTIFMGGSATITAMRQWHPDLRYALIEYPTTGVIRSGEYLQALGVTAYATPASGVGAAAVAYWHAYGLDVLTWTSDTTALDVPATWDQVTSAGVDAIITNRPADTLANQAGGC